MLTRGDRKAIPLSENLRSAGLDADTLRKVKALLGGEVSLASVASWADDYRALNPKSGAGTS